MGGGEEGPGSGVETRAVSFHPAAHKELSKLDSASRKRVAATIDSLAAGDEGLQTHALNGPLKGWQATKATRGHRVIHRDLDDGILHVGYVGLHEYETAQRRLAVTEFFRHAGERATDHSQQALLAEAAAVDHSDGVMVALLPPAAVADDVAHEGGQPPEDLHITLAYLGNTADYSERELAVLPQLVSAWAVRQKPVQIRTGGVGKFANPDKGQHVLYAAMDISGGAQLHSDLARYLERHRYRLPSEHGWTPHMTLRYVDQHFRFMPHVPEHRWTATAVYTYVGQTRHEARLGTLPSGTATP
ncbi:2'-5' RNA ligase family protein [Streptomyces sp. NPDC059761]|uniref:2'-5' RNA ligase family protein n=1 Tax=Streptomyces sp. NPDC059761 TaxID=3346937 RepID=UPI003663B5EE